MGFFKKVFRPVSKIAKKIIPKEIRPTLPFIASAAFGPAGMFGGVGSQYVSNAALRQALAAGITSAATDEDGNPLRAAGLAAAPALLSQGVGALGQGTGSIADFVNKTKTIRDGDKIMQTKSLVEKARALAEPSGFIDTAKVVGGQTAIDQSAKFAEIRQDEIDAYNRNLLEQGVASKVDRRNAIFGIYKNAGYDEDYVNTMLDTYGYADGGRIDFANGGGYRARAAEAMKGIMTMKDLLKDKPVAKPATKIEADEDEEIQIDEDGKIKISRKDDLAGGLMAAMDGVQKAYGRSFGEMEPVPMMRFARGGEVEIEEETDDLGIMDLMRDQGIEYGEQASYGFDDAMGETFEMFLDYKKKGTIPMEMEFDEFLELLQGRKEQGIKGTQVASGYKDDIEEMYEQYVFEMEEQGLQPMDFASFLRQAQSGMASGGRVNYAGGGASYNSSARYSFLINKYNKGIPLTPSEEDELEMLEMTYADDSQGMAGGGKVGALMELGKAGIKSSMQGLSKLKNMVVTKLSRMTDDVELRGSTDYAEDTGASFELQVTAKTKKGKKTLDSLVEEGVVEKLDDNTYFISDANRDSISGMKGLKASGMLDEGAETFTRFDEGAGMGPYDMPYAGYDEVIETFKKAEGGIMNRNLLNTGMDKDMRAGGFIPEGTKEKADDVPARLSKNEFVMTADAVRAAGGGSVNEGAKRMYETMHKLEAKV